jgi:hypothetical protein
MMQGVSILEGTNRQTASNTTQRSAETETAMTQGQERNKGTQPLNMSIKPLLSAASKLLHSQDATKPATMYGRMTSVVEPGRPLLQTLSAGSQLLDI